MPNFNKLFTLDAETIDILKDEKNQSQTVREAVKRYARNKNVMESKEPEIKRTEGKIIGAVLE